jgi:hypothetical protein
MAAIQGGASSRHTPLLPTSHSKSIKLTVPPNRLFGFAVGAANRAVTEIGSGKFGSFWPLNLHNI